MKKTLLYIALVLSSGIAHADCWYNGYYYPPGTTIASFICQEDGSWQ